jgi:hypothetical protein
MNLDTFRTAREILDAEAVPTEDRMIYVPDVGPLPITHPTAVDYINRECARLGIGKVVARTT